MVQTDRIVAPVLAIAGPTAVGKSELGVALAERLNGEIVSADSMQIYRRMDIGTAKPTEAERRGVPHYMIDVVDCTQSYTANEYAEAARAVIADIRTRRKTPIVVGGSGMYLRGLLSGYHFESFGGDEALRARFTAYAAQRGNEALHALLAERNPERAAQLHANDVKRVVRALELEELGQRALPRQTPMPHLLFILNTDRSVLYERIDRRVRLMYERGLVEEVRSLLDAGVPGDAQAMRAIGYAEIVRCLERGVDPAVAEAEIARNSRKYAKRQLTYFRSMNPSIWLETSDGIDTMCRIIKEKYQKECNL